MEDFKEDSTPAPKSRKAFLLKTESLKEKLPHPWWLPEISSPVCGAAGTSKTPDGRFRWNNSAAGNGKAGGQKHCGRATGTGLKRIATPTIFFLGMVGVFLCRHLFRSTTAIRTAVGFGNFYCHAGRLPGKEQQHNEEQG
jgi:hypothetical protein